MSTTQQRTSSGGAIAGNAGLLGDYAYDQYEKSKQSSYQKGHSAGYNKGAQQ